MTEQKEKTVCGVADTLIIMTVVVISWMYIHVSKLTKLNMCSVFYIKNILLKV